jgi:hypothetical protein
MDPATRYRSASAAEARVRQHDVRKRVEAFS